MLRCSARFYKNRPDALNTARSQDLVRLTVEEPSSPVPVCVLWRSVLIPTTPGRPCVFRSFTCMDNPQAAAAARPSFRSA